MTKESKETGQFVGLGALGVGQDKISNKKLSGFWAETKIREEYSGHYKIYPDTSKTSDDSLTHLSSKTITVQWIPYPVEISGNERAEDLAALHQIAQEMYEVKGRNISKCEVRFLKKTWFVNTALH